MKIKVDRKTLIEGIKIVAPFTDPKNKALPFLSKACFKLSKDQDCLLICGTNLKSTGVAKVPAIAREPAETSDYIGYCVPAKLIIDTIVALPDTITEIYISTDSNGKILFHNEEVTKRYTIEYESNDYDFFREDGFKTIITMPSKVFVNYCEKVLPFTSNDDLKVAMCAVEMEIKPSVNSTYFSFAATDAHSLKTQSTYIPTNEPSVTVNVTEDYTALFENTSIAGIVNDLKKAGNGQLIIEESSRAFRFLFTSASGIESSIWIQKIDAKFPDYKKIIPNAKDAKVKITTNRQQLIKTCKLLKNYASNETTLCRIDLNLDMNTLILKASDVSDSNEAMEKLPAYCDGNGEGFKEFGVNLKLFQRTLESFDHEEITIAYFTSSSALLIQSPLEVSADDMVTYTPVSDTLLMPVMLDY